MLSAPTAQAGPKTRDPITDVAEQYRKPDDYLYLLVDGQAECALDHPLRLKLLIGAMGTQAGDLLGPIRFWLFPSSWEGYSLIRDARRLGLKDSSDLIALSLHRVFYHPDLPQHPDIQKTIAQARAGDMDLQSNFREYTPNDWKRIVAELPRAEDYS